MPKGTETTIKLGTQYRAATVDAVSEADRTVSLSFSSEEPVDRWFGQEILDHGSGSVDMDWFTSGRAPFLADHDQRRQIGVIESASIDDKRGEATVRFGKSAAAEEYFQDVKDGIRGNISVGYRVNKLLLEEENDETTIYRALSWRPMEISLVSIPADESVGVGRSAGEDVQAIPIITRNQPSSEELPMPDPLPAAAPQASPAAPAPVAQRETELESAVNNARAAELTRITEIEAMGHQHGFGEAARQFINEGKSVEDFRAHILDNLDQRQEPISARAEQHGALGGISADDAREYSIVRAMRAVALGDWSIAPVEREIHEETRKKFSANRQFQGNLLIPSDILMQSRMGGKREYEGYMEQRTLVKGTDTAGGYLIGTDHMAANFIELLRNKMLVRRMGVRVLSGLVGDLTIPKQTGGASASWIDPEIEESPESEMTFGQVGRDPKSVTTHTQISRKMLLQSSPDIESLVREDLALAIALKLDHTVLKGSGVGKEPLGIYNTTGVNSVTISAGAPTFANMVDMETEVALDNADLGALGYISSVSDRGKLKQKPKEAGQAIYVWTEGNEPGVGMVNGYRAGATNQLTANENVFGNWGDVFVGEWGILDVNVNPYSKDTQGIVRVTVFQDADVALRHPESFCITQI